MRILKAKKKVRNHGQAKISFLTTQFEKENAKKNTRQSDFCEESIIVSCFSSIGIIYDYRL